MLSDEERKAIEKISANKNESTWNDTIRQIKREEIKDVVVTRQKYITTVLNLIEKQQKELQQEKEKNKELEEKLKMSIEMLTISKDKIRAKIKELENLIETNSLYEECWNKIEVLKGLLEEN